MSAIPLLFHSEDDEDPGLFRLDTNVGGIVVLFRSRQEMGRFAQLMAPRMAAHGEVLRCVETPFDRVDDVEAMLYSRGVARPGDEIFVGSEHPIWTDLIAHLESELPGDSPAGVRQDQVREPAAASEGLTADVGGKDEPVPWVSFHTFRHTCASLLFAEGKNVKQVQE